MARSFTELSEQEILALAISSEEDDSRIYGQFADRLKTDYPATARVLRSMRDEELGHAHRLMEIFKANYGDNLPFIRRQDVKGFVTRKPLWLSRLLTVDQVRKEVETMEYEARSFYEAAAKRTLNLSVRRLLNELALVEASHEEMAAGFRESMESSGALDVERETARRMFILQYVQPGLAGLMDGSVSTLAPVFAAAFATRDSHDAFLVGLAASIGAGISMGFAEALSDDGVISGRGHPYIRGAVCGLMTTLGGIGHTLPFLIRGFGVATACAVAVVAVELALIAWIRHRYMDTPLLAATFQVVVGGVLVFVAGILIGSS
jgi:erythrin-vacuolar iron transport family protein